jgi:hypothetical protein
VSPCTDNIGLRWKTVYQGQEGSHRGVGYRLRHTVLCERRTTGLKGRRTGRVDLEGFLPPQGQENWESGLGGVFTTTCMNSILQQVETGHSKLFKFPRNCESLLIPYQCDDSCVPLVLRSL